MAKALLAVSVVALGGFILWVGSGSVGPFVAGLVKGFGGFVEHVGTAVGSTPPTEAPTISGAPIIAAPEQPYTNVEEVDITINLPSAIVGQADHKVRLWVTLPETAPAVLAEAAVGQTSVLVIPGVILVKGRNDLQASIVGPGGESDLSPVATWILDITKPKVEITSPKDGASVTKATATIKGKTQAGSEVRLVNSANGAVATATAATDGLWESSIAVGGGPNLITVTVTDPAGNTNTATLTLRKGTGTLKADLTGSTYRFKAAKLPQSITLTVRVTNPDGQAMAGSTALFTLSVPGLEAIVSGEVRTGADGTATFTTAIPAGATKGGGLATVLVTTDAFGTATDRVVITIE